MYDLVCDSTKHLRHDVVLDGRSSYIKPLQGFAGPGSYDILDLVAQKLNTSAKTKKGSFNIRKQLYGREFAKLQRSQETNKRIVTTNTQAIQNHILKRSLSQTIPKEKYALRRYQLQHILLASGNTGGSSCMLPPSPPLPLPVSESTTVPVVRAPPPPAQSVPPPIPPVKSIDIRASDPRKRLTRMNAQRQRKGVKFSLENNSTGSPTIGTAISTTSTTTATATTTATTTTTPLLSEAEKIEILQALASPTPTNLDVFVEGYHRRSLNTTFLEAPDQIEDLQEEESGEEDNEVENAGEEDREIKKETDQLTPAIQTKSIMGSHCITLNYSKKEKHRQRQPHSRVMVVMSYQQFLQKQTSYLKRFQRLRKNKLRVDKQLNEL